MMTVSIGIVALNEEEYLPSLLENIEDQTYPHENIEVLLIDSGSHDKTKDIMNNFKMKAAYFRNIEVLDNPKKKQASGWNIAIQNFLGDILIRIDAHSEIPKDFIEKNVKLIESGEYIAGGLRPCKIINENAWTRTLLQAENSMFGSSINACRRSKTKKYVKTMFHAAYRREVFEKVGKFNENLGRTEDNELHWRMRQAGYKFCFAPDIISYQYARSGLKKMLKQKYENGYWIGLTVGVCPKCLSVFYFIPFCFVMALFVSLLCFFMGTKCILSVLLTVYGAVTILMSFLTIVQNGFTKFSILLPVLFFLLHCSYGIGTLLGIGELLKKRNKS